MDFEIKLIREVKKHSMLYDWGSEGYRNQSLKDQVWHEISSLLGTDVDSCKKKWRTLRDTYNKTKHRDTMELSLGKKAYKRPWKYSKYLSFLNECTSRYKREHRRLKSDIFEPDNTVNEEFEVRNDAADSAEEMGAQNDSESGEEIELQNNTTENEGVFKFDPDSECVSENINKNYSFVDEDPIVSHDPAKKKPSANLEKCLIATMNSVQDYLHRPRETETTNKYTHTNGDSEDELFCRSMMRKLQKFPLKKKNEAKISIMRYLSIKESDLDKKKYIKQ